MSASILNILGKITTSTITGEPFIMTPDEATALQAMIDNLIDKSEHKPPTVSAPDWTLFNNTQTVSEN